MNFYSPILLNFRMKESYIQIYLYSYIQSYLSIYSYKIQAGCQVIPRAHYQILLWNYTHINFHHTEQPIRHRPVPYVRRRYFPIVFGACYEWPSFFTRFIMSRSNSYDGFRVLKFHVFSYFCLHCVSCEKILSTNAPGLLSTTTQKGARSWCELPFPLSHTSPLTKKHVHHSVCHEVQLLRSRNGNEYVDVFFFFIVPHMLLPIRLLNEELEDHCHVAYLCGWEWWWVTKVLRLLGKAFNQHFLTAFLQCKSALIILCIREKPIQFGIWPLYLHVYTA